MAVVWNIVKRGVKKNKLLDSSTFGFGVFELLYERLIFNLTLNE